MSVYNSSVTLAAALQSIQSQSLKDWELIAIDDGSTDGSGQILDAVASADSRIQVVHQDNRGLGLSLATAASHVTTPLIARMDADDLSAPGRLTAQCSYMERHPSVGLSGTWYICFDPMSGPYEIVKAPDSDSKLRRSLLRGSNPFCHGTAIFRTDIYRAVSGYRLRKYCEELDLWLQISERSVLGMLESTQYLYRKSVNGMSYLEVQRNESLKLGVVRLAEERRLHGHELTDFKAWEEGVLARKAVATDADRFSTDLYDRGLLSLRRGDYGGFSAIMRQIAFVPGRMQHKALRLYRLRKFSSLLRYLLWLRQSRPGSVRRIALPAGSPYPDWAIPLLSSAAETPA
jgi:glycosyltransferase involved in cell wall biosynthesis